MNSGHSPVGPRPIGYYVHHHGAGHAARFTNISQQYARQFHGDERGDDGDDARGEGGRAAHRPLIALSESALAAGVLLPTDVPAVALDPTAGGALHWAPLASDVSSPRVKTVIDWIVRERPVGMVVDVSVEMALLCRLAGVPTIIVRQHGSRVDMAHELAFRTAARLLAPFPAVLEHCSTPAWVVRKTTYCGFISPSPEQDDADGADGESEPVPRRDDVVVLWGRGGGTMTSAAISALAAAVPKDTVVWIAGELPYDGIASNVESLGFVRRADRLLRNAPTVVASAGNNVVSEAASQGCALLVVPQDRPFEEQLRHAAALDAASAAAVVDGEPSIGAWKSALRTAHQRRPVLAALGAVNGSRAAARILGTVFD